MCGRITLTSPAAAVAELFGLAAVPGLEPRYNIAPSQLLAAVRSDERTASRRLDHLRWGLVPYWAKDPAIGNRMINARADSLASKPAFESAFRKRRCLVVVSGFYEWQRAGKHSQPYLLHRRDNAPFALAGLWEVWRDPAGTRLETCAVVTTEANALMRPIHDRMPVILRPEEFAAWLDPATVEPSGLARLLRPANEGALEAVPVSTYVNDPRNDGARCIEPHLPDPELNL
jgi:putative SOS response-associated peptidase YedK